MTLEQAKQNGIDVAYQQWMQHPMTQMLLKHLHIHQEKQILDALNNSTTVSITDDTIRRSCVSARNTLVLISAISNFDLFIKMGTTQEELLIEQSKAFKVKEKDLGQIQKQPTQFSTAD